MPASVTATVVPAATVVPVPGLVTPAVGLVLTEDRVATVLRIGSHESRHMIVCDIDGGSVALDGARVLATGVFPEAQGGCAVLWQGLTAEDLDVRALTVEVEEAIWRAGALGQDERQG